jgi:hypothetical protein
MSQGILLIEIVGSLQLRMQAGGVAGLGKWVIGIGNRNDPDGANLNAQDGLEREAPRNRVSQSHSGRS